MEYFLIALSLLCTTTGQLLQKLAADKVHAANKDAFFSAILTRKEAWFALLFLATGMVFWLAVLYRVDVSTAYPFLSIGLVLVMLVSHFYLNENVTAKRLAGAVLIMAGIALVSIA